MANDNRQFTIAVKKFVDDSIELTNTQRRKLAIDFFSDVTMRTPVDKGVARANWNPSIGAPDLTFDAEKTDKTGEETITKIQSVVNSLKYDTTLYLSNATPYIQKLEFGLYSSKNALDPKSKVTSKGFSKQAPQGIVRIAIEELKGK